MRQAGTGGTERYLNQVAKLACERGHEVTIVCRSHEEPPHPDCRFEVLRPFSIGGAMRMKNFARAVEAHVKSASYDLVFGLGKTYTHDLIRLGGGCHATYLELAHRDTLEPWEKVVGKGKLKHRLALQIEDRALARGAYRRVITNSEMVKRDVIERHAVPEDAVDVVYNGVDCERFDLSLRENLGSKLRGSLGIGPGERVVLFLGTGYGRKGLAPLMEAFARLAKSDASLTLMVVGYDSAQSSFERRAAELGLAGRVHFLGGRRDTETCYAAANLYVLPTRYDPFANTTLEALASGLPVITTRTNGGHELLSEGVDGSVLDAPDADEIERALRFWTDGNRCQAARAATRSLAERHPARRVAEESLAVCERVVAELALE